MNTDTTRITDLAEVAKLIRQNNGARIWLHTDSGALTGSVRLSRAAALDALNKGELDHFIAANRSGLLYLNDETAPPEIWVPRAYPRKLAELAEYRACQAKANAVGTNDGWLDRSIARMTKELTEFETTWAAHLPQQSVAA